MINILIKDRDDLYHHSMQLFLTNLFKAYFSKSVNFISEYTEGNIAFADVIILSLCQGERYICHPELRARSKGIIIGLVEGDEAGEISPSCFVDIVYISRKSTLAEMASLIYMAWKKWLLSPNYTPVTSCLRCKYRQMSSQQRCIMARISQGQSVKQIAYEMGMSSKTVFTHKYLMMNKFNLHSDLELLILLTRFTERGALVA